MGFFEDLKNGDIKNIILVIFGILLFHLYWCKSSKHSQCKESMTNLSNDIKEAVKQVYLADVEAIRNLSEIATKINAGTFVFPGNLTVTGSFKANGEISNNSLSLSGLNNSINNVNSSLTNSINNQISNVNSTISSNHSQFNSFKSNFDGYQFKKVCMRNSSGSGWRSWIDYDKTCDELGIQNIKNWGWDQGGFSAIIPTKGRYN